jgi:hypothetical protein
MKRQCVLIFSLFISILLPACAQNRLPEARLKAKKAIYPPLRTAIIEAEPYPGSPLTVAIIGLDDCEEEPLRAELLFGHKLYASARFFPSGLFLENHHIYLAILGIPSTSPIGAAEVQIAGGRWPGLLRDKKGNELPIVADELRILPLDIVGREYTSMTIKMNAANTALIYKQDPQKERESKELWQLLLTANPLAVHASEAFAYPFSWTRRSASFGDRRTYSYSNGKTGLGTHDGTDFPAPKGTAIFAPGPGRVLLAKPRIVSGNSVIIEHLPGLYSLYYHLDAIDVREGLQLMGGEVLGKIGSTGFSTGPHLHWELRAGGIAIDPEYYIERPLIDKKLIITTMNAKYGRIAEGG